MKTAIIINCSNYLRF